MSGRSRRTANDEVLTVRRFVLNGIVHPSDTV
jgi:hypothetical protein